MEFMDLFPTRLSLTYDHRSIDGGEATRFLKQIAEEENLEIELF